MIFSSNSSFTGAFIIASNSAAQFGNNSASGGIASSNIIDYGNLALNYNTATSFTNPVYGNGTISQIGSGSLT